MDRVTLRDVAMRAGVSVMTVSNVGRGYRHVSPRMRERVQAAIDELDYRPNLSGRSLATGRSRHDRDHEVVPRGGERDDADGGLHGPSRG